MKVAISSLIMGAGILAACASQPVPPSPALVAAEVAINNAEKMPAHTYGNPELIVARQLLASARKAVDSEEMELAEQLAIQSRLSSELAMAKTALGQTTAIGQDIKSQSNAMQQEMLRHRKATP